MKWCRRGLHDLEAPGATRADAYAWEQVSKQLSDQDIHSLLYSQSGINVPAPYDFPSWSLADQLEVVPALGLKVIIHSATEFQVLVDIEHNLIHKDPPPVVPFTELDLTDEKGKPA